MLPGSLVVKYLCLTWSTLYVLIVLLGAPIFSEIAATSFLTTLLVLFSALPVLLVVRSEERLLELITSLAQIKLNISESFSLFIAAGTLIGAWAGAFVYPLDWDRWWQRYPLPSLFGCVFGATVGLGLGYIKFLSGRFGHYNINDVPKLLAVFLAEFHNTSGPVIKYQAPEGYITHNAFLQNAHLIIPKPQLFLHTLKISQKHEQCKVLGYPVGLDHAKYGRGRYTFNMCFVVAWDSVADTMYEPIVQKCAEYLIELEQEYHFLTNEQYQSDVVRLINKMYENLNSKGESIVEIPIDEQMTTLYFKLCPSYRGIEPPEVSVYMVPMFIREVDMSNRLIEKMDVLSQKIIPQIDGIKTVKEIASILELDTSLVARCVRNLHFYECVSLVPMFLYSNTYVATERVHDFYMNQTEITDCLDFVKIQGVRTVDGSVIPMPNPEFSDVFRLYLSMKCGMSLSEWVQVEKPRTLFIDEHRLVQFGMHHQFLRKLTIYPISIVHPGHSRFMSACNGKTSLEELALENNVAPEVLYQALEDSKKFEFVMK